MYLLELLRSLKSDDDDNSEFDEPMIFVSADAESPLLDRESIIDEEIVNYPHQRQPEGMAELLPVWLALEFVEINKSELHTGSKEQLEERLRNFVQIEW
ncbi:MAG: hypothetical protein MI807_02510 [Verrucomicrobiales bacterium]|nr:hypothetical protein [Verrucomicrobiales bacterium]